MANISRTFGNNGGRSLNLQKVSFALMQLHGIVYQAPSLAKRVFYQLMRGIGAGLVAFAVTGIIFSFWPIIKEEIDYKFFRPKVVVSKFGDILDKIYAGQTSEVKNETADLGINSFFSINIPKISARANIISNVDAGNPDEYLRALQEGVAHAKGTNFPGSGHTIYLFSHSTDSPLNFARYNAVFYLLGKLNVGDRITVYFLDKKYVYQVQNKIITSPSDTSWLNDDGSGERLILQTCDPPGTSWNRLLIIARPI